MMNLEIGKKFFQLFHKVLCDPEYAEVAQEFKISQEKMQKLHFSEEQHQALDDYLYAFTKVYETILSIGLENQS